MNPEKFTNHLRAVYHGLDTLTDDINLEHELSLIEAKNGNFSEFVENYSKSALARMRVRDGRVVWDPTKQTFTEFLANAEQPPICWESEHPLDQETIITILSNDRIPTAAKAT